MGEIVDEVRLQVPDPEAFGRIRAIVKSAHKWGGDGKEPSFDKIRRVLTERHPDVIAKAFGGDPDKAAAWIKDNWMAMHGKVNVGKTGAGPTFWRKGRKRDIVHASNDAQFLFGSDEPGRLRDDGLVWKPILRTGSWTFNPTGADGPLVIDGDFIAQIVDNFEAGAWEHVTIPKTHGNAVDENTGYVRALEVRDDPARPGQVTLWAGMEFTDSRIREMVLDGSIPNVSVGVKLGKIVRPEDGAAFERVLYHVALTNQPFINGLTPFGKALVASIDAVIGTDGYLEEETGWDDESFLSLLAIDDINDSEDPTVRLMADRDWESHRHPRWPSGTPRGGEFMELNNLFRFNRDGEKMRLPSGIFRQHRNVKDVFVINRSDDNRSGPMDVDITLRDGKTHKVTLDKAKDKMGDLIDAIEKVDAGEAPDSPDSAMPDDPDEREKLVKRLDEIKKLPTRLTKETDEAKEIMRRLAEIDGRSTPSESGADKRTSDLRPAKDILPGVLDRLKPDGVDTPDGQSPDDDERARLTKRLDEIQKLPTRLASETAEAKEIMKRLAEIDGPGDESSDTGKPDTVGPDAKSPDVDFVSVILETRTKIDDPVAGKKVDAEFLALHDLLRKLKIAPMATKTGAEGLDEILNSPDLHTQLTTLSKEGDGDAKTALESITRLKGLRDLWFKGDTKLSRDAGSTKAAGGSAGINTKEVIRMHTSDGVLELSHDEFQRRVDEAVTDAVKQEREQSAQTRERLSRTEELLHAAHVKEKVNDLQNRGVAPAVCVKVRDLLLASKIGGDEVVLTLSREGVERKLSMEAVIDDLVETFISSGTVALSRDSVKIGPFDARPERGDGDTIESRAEKLDAELRAGISG